jgi:hypothetical protein
MVPAFKKEIHTPGAVGLFNTDSFLPRLQDHSQMKKSLYIIFFVALLLAFFYLFSRQIFDMGDSIPYGLTVSVVAKIEPNRPFHFDIILEAREIDISDAKIVVSLPPEVELVDGVLVWQGQIMHGTDYRQNMIAKSVVDMSKWSSEVKVRIDFTVSGGEKVWREVKWSANGIEDSDWNGVNYISKKRGK